MHAFEPKIWPAVARNYGRYRDHPFAMAYWQQIALSAASLMTFHIKIFAGIHERKSWPSSGEILAAMASIDADIGRDVFGPATLIVARSVQQALKFAKGNFASPRRGARLITASTSNAANHAGFERMRRQNCRESPREKFAGPPRSFGRADLLQRRDTLHVINARRASSRPPSFIQLPPGALSSRSPTPLVSLSTEHLHSGALIDDHLAQLLLQ